MIKQNYLIHKPTCKRPDMQKFIVNYNNHSKAAPNSYVDKTLIQASFYLTLNSRKQKIEYNMENKQISFKVYLKINIRP